MRYRMYAFLALTLLASACEPMADTATEAANSQLTNAQQPQEQLLISDQTKPAGDSSLGAPAGIRPSYFDCTRKHEGETLEIGYCISEEREYQDKRLNGYYKALSKKLAASQRKQLVGSQRAWLTFYGKEEALQSVIYGPDQISNLQIGENELFMLCERANKLKSYLAFVRD